MFWWEPGRESMDQGAADDGVSGLGLDPYALRGPDDRGRPLEDASRQKPDGRPVNRPAWTPRVSPGAVLPLLAPRFWPKLVRPLWPKGTVPGRPKGPVLFEWCQNRGLSGRREGFQTRRQRGQTSIGGRQIASRRAAYTNGGMGTDDGRRARSRAKKEGTKRGSGRGQTTNLEHERSSETKVTNSMISSSVKTTAIGVPSLL